MLEGVRWQTVSWRTGTKGRLLARFAAARVRLADGPTQRIHDMGAQHLPGEDVWVIGEHRSTGERKYYLSTLPAIRQAILRHSLSPRQYNVRIAGKPSILIKYQNSADSYGLKWVDDFTAGRARFWAPLSMDGKYSHRSIEPVSA